MQLAYWQAWAFATSCVQALDQVVFSGSQNGRTEPLNVAIIGAAVI